MGYNSWYDLMCSPYMNETTLHATADAMVEKGLVKLGYNYLNLDDCELPAISPRCSPTPTESLTRDRRAEHRLHHEP